MSKNIIWQVLRFSRYPVFRVDLSENRLYSMPQKSFSESNLRERDHLPELLANQPSVLGEEWLSIQKWADRVAD